MTDREIVEFAISILESPIPGDPLTLAEVLRTLLDGDFTDD